MALKHLYSDGGRGLTESLRIVRGIYLAGLKNVIFVQFWTFPTAAAWWLFLCYLK